MADTEKLEKTGKRMPYRVPEHFFDNIEDQIFEYVKADLRDPKPKPTFNLWYTAISGLAAACIVLLVTFNYIGQEKTTDDFEAFEQAFCQLSSADQNYFFETYQNDLFINEYNQ